jgi:hypothetical protein
MADPLLKIGISQDATEATIAPAATTPVETAAQVEQLIVELSSLRNAMRPPVTSDPPPRERWRVKLTDKPMIYPDAGDAMILALRDSGTGWQLYRCERNALVVLHNEIGKFLEANQPMTRQ